MGRIFLDIGAHDGQTLAEVIKPGHGFDQVFAFEPMPAQFDHLVGKFGGSPRVHLLNYGLADVDGWRLMYGTNVDMEASIFPEKNDLVDPGFATLCAFTSASAFFRQHIPAGETVVAKLNCEGSEAIIINDMIDSGEIWKLSHFMVDFDVRKIPGQEHTESEVLARLAAIGFTRFVLSEEVMRGETHQARIANWLSTIEVSR